ncbi:MAG: NAD(P)-dependent alcohol dehydrogenase [Labilithrix sp.]|nr:NAD(P)-dependent alcohol dehydrogenase [Labilithrix sp.]
MNAITYSHFGGPDVLKLTRSESPRVGSLDLLVRVRAVSVNPLDGKIRRGELRLLSGARFPKTPGIDFAGVVEAVGAKVTGFAVGDRVFGYPGSMRKGTLSEVVSVPAASAAKIPRGLDDVGAASVAMVGLAALQAIRDVAHVAPKERVLVNGATGGVGLMLLQLARLRGAHVTAVASTKGVPVAHQFGADDVVDYRSESIADIRERFDVVFDTSTKLPFSAARRLLEPRGRYVGFEPSPLSLIGSALLNPFRRQKHLILVAKPSAADLAEIGRMIDAHEVVLPPEEAFDLPDAARAFERVERGGVIGKVVIRLPNA